MHWKTLSSKYISQHRYFTARVDTCQMPNGTVVPEYYVVELPVTVCALAVTEDNKAVLVKQYRHPIQQTLIEIPGGFIDAGETPEQAIGRELLEETGYAFSNIYAVGKIAANPGVLQSITHLFLATGGKKVATQNLDFNEEIEVQLIPVEAVCQMLQRNEFVQALHTTCLLYAFQKWDELKR
ncbi:MAG TPA: NUDIX hydrolase [Ferruginibacter sp.]|nr:NUDIX hydrolase [Ferruginibacter sp.]HMP20896.1 NUDIX hydrolase [Ferruginibacter sp.]